MILETLGLDSAIKLATPIAKKLFKKKLLPLIESKVINSFNTQVTRRKFEKTSIKYLAKLTGQCSIMNTIAFQNAPKKLNDLYINLTISDSDDGQSIVVDNKTDIFNSCHHILVTDTAGMGKSTLSKRIILNVIDQGEYIPVFVELRQLENQPIEEYVANSFGIPSKNAIDVIKKLPLLYVFDGMDEVQNDIKKDILNYLREFIEQIGDSNVLITSRNETFLSEFYSFKRYSINKLSNDEAYSLLTKCDPTGVVSKKLIQGISNNQSRGLNEFLSTPLYVSLLFCAYRHKTVIPQKKHLFYSQVYEALFESHDLSKEIGFVRPKHSRLDSAEFHTILRRLGFWCLKNNGQIEFQKDALEIIVTDLIGNINGIDASAPNFVKDLTTTVPLFVKEGSTIRWSHKSLMEYFASMFICNDAKTNQSPLLLKLFDTNEWSDIANVFELCADIDYGTFRVSIVKRVLENYLLHFKTSYQNITNRLIPKEEIEYRIRLTFACSHMFKMRKSITGLSFTSIDIKKYVGSIACQKHTNFEIQTLEQDMVADKILGIFHCFDEKYEVIKIIRSKSPELFFTDNINTVDFKLLFSKSSLINDKAYILSDNPKLILNNSKHFALVNRCISQYNSYTLDKQAVLKEIALIEKDDSNGIDELIDGI